MNVAAGSRITFAIRTTAGELAGITSYLDLRAHDGGVEIGNTMMFASHRRTVANTAAKRLLLGHAFECGLDRVALKTDARNLRSRAAIERIGARFEGILRNYQRRADGSLRDTAMFSITASEWPDVRRRLDTFLAR